MENQELIKCYTEKSEFDSNGRIVENMDICEQHNDSDKRNSIEENTDQNVTEGQNNLGDNNNDSDTAESANYLTEEKEILGTSNDEKTNSDITEDQNDVIDLVSSPGEYNNGSDTTEKTPTESSIQGTEEKEGGVDVQEIVDISDGSSVAIVPENRKRSKRLTGTLSFENIDFSQLTQLPAHLLESHRQQYDTCDSKMLVLKKLKSKYFCSLCNKFASSDDNEFNKHLSAHRGKRELNCLFCCVTVHFSKATKHFDRHFADLLNQAHCQICREEFDVTTIESVLEHVNLLHEHPMKCPVCLAEFGEPLDLYYHVMSSVKELKICGGENCLVMSHDEDLFNGHLEESGHDAEAVRVSAYMNCVSACTSEYVEDCCRLKTKNKQELEDFQDRAGEESGFKERIYNKTMEQLNETVVECATKYSMTYSRRMMRKLFSGHIDVDRFEELQQKMDIFSTMEVQVGFVENKRLFLCGVAQCEYYSSHSASDVRKHIMGVHCGVPNDCLKFCMQTAKIDPQYKLVSEKNMIQSCNYNRQQESERSGKPIELLVDSETEAGTTPLRKEKKNTNAGAKRRRSAAVQIPNESNKKRRKELPNEVQPNYSATVLEQIFQLEPELTGWQEMLRAKLSLLIKHKGVFVVEGDKRMVRCCSCEDMTRPRLFKKYYDFFQHIMVHHLQLPQEVRDVVRTVTRTDNQYRLLPDDVLLTRWTARD